MYYLVTLSIDKATNFLYNIIKERWCVMENFVNIIVNNGVAVGIIVYFIYRDNKFMNTLTKTLTTLQDSVSSVKELLEHYINKKGDSDEERH